MIDLIGIITAADPGIRNQSLEGACADLSARQLLEQCAALDAFRRRSDNLYERVRALFFLYAIYRFHLPPKLQDPSLLTRHASHPLIPFKGYEHLLQRRFEEAIDHFLQAQHEQGPNDAISSALAAACHRLGFQTLADQVRRSVRSVRGNQWMFRMGHAADQPLRIRPELLRANPEDGTYPILRECTPVRMDLTHCGWSDIFFLGMDFPEGAKVLNVSVDLGLHGRDVSPRPPVEAYLRVIDEPILRLVSIDVGMRATGQARSLTGALSEKERRLVAARAILGEWLGGSGGGWQDSGGIWPGIKLIHGVKAGERDPEFGISRGRLLPNHKIFSTDD